MSINSLTLNPEFQKTKIHQTFSRQPVGMVDVGSMGGVHPLMHPIAGLACILCFEPQEDAYRAFLEQYAVDNPYAKVHIEHVAVGGNASHGRKFYVTRRQVNSSLLQPGRQMVDRYGAQGFTVNATCTMSVQTLDTIVYGKNFSAECYGEILKLDAQGSEYDLLQGADKLLRERCVAIWCEAEFFQVYENQKTYPDIQCLLRDYGFTPYGLYPRYVSTKTLSAQVHQTQERLKDADVLFFKDPLDCLNAQRKFSDRQLQVLILAAMALKFYDFAVELVQKLYGEGAEYLALKSLICRLAEKDKKAFLQDFQSLLAGIDSNDRDAYVQIRNFVDEHRFNGSVEYLTKAYKEPSGTRT